MTGAFSTLNHLSQQKTAFPSNRWENGGSQNLQNLPKFKTTKEKKKTITGKALLLHSSLRHLNQWQ